MNNISYVIDLDNTICESNRNKSYKDLLPIIPVIDKIRQLKNSGAYIIIHTARGMKSNKGDKGAIDAFVRPIIERWLQKHDIPYHELIVAKPGYKSFTDKVYYVDDRSLSRKEFIESDSSKHESLIDTTITYE